MDAWFGKKEKVDVKQLGRPYVITDYGVVADSAKFYKDLFEELKDV